MFLFLYTDDFWRDFNAYKAKGVEFAREPSEAPYGTVAVFKDLYGTLWDLVQMKIRDKCPRLSQLLAQYEIET